MATYTGHSLDKLCKQHLIPIVLSLQSKLEDKDNTILEEVRKLNDSVSKLHAELGVTKNINILLVTRLSTFKRDSAGQMPNIQGENVLILWGSLARCLEKFWMIKF